MKTKLELSVESCAALEVALAGNLSSDEERYAANVRAGIRESDEEMKFLLEHIGGQTQLLDVLRRAVQIHVTLPAEGEPSTPQSAPRILMTFRDGTRLVVTYEDFVKNHERLGRFVTMAPVPDSTPLGLQP